MSGYAMKLLTQQWLSEKDKVRYLVITLGLFAVLLSSCSNADPHLQKLAQDVYSQQNLIPPLPPSTFKSDGCSCWPDYEWLDCCVKHDAIYWMGGTREERKIADINLQQCVSQKGHRIIGKIMYYGVRAGGVYWLPTPYRWGFGWEYPQSGPPNKQY